MVYADCGSRVNIGKGMGVHVYASPVGMMSGVVSKAQDRLLVLVPDKGPHGSTIAVVQISISIYNLHGEMGHAKQKWRSSPTAPVLDNVYARERERKPRHFHPAYIGLLGRICLHVLGPRRRTNLSSAKMQKMAGNAKPAMLDRSGM